MELLVDLCLHPIQPLQAMTEGGMMNAVLFFRSSVNLFF